MSLSMTIFSMIAAWLAIAFAMLWGILRIARRHAPAAPAPVRRERAPLVPRHATA